MNYREPWQDEGWEALEIVHGDPSLPVAWTVDDDVFVRTWDTTEWTTEWDDGYALIGQLEWVDTPGDPADDMGYNLDRLRDFVSKWRKENGR